MVFGPILLVLQLPLGRFSSRQSEQVKKAGKWSARGYMGCLPPQQNLGALLSKCWRVLDQKLALSCPNIGTSQSAGWPLQTGRRPRSEDWPTPGYWGGKWVPRRAAGAIAHTMMALARKWPTGRSLLNTAQMVGMLRKKRSEAILSPIFHT